jgi:flagellar motor switch protein FliM
LSNVLSQDEIDALLSALSSGEDIEEMSDEPSKGEVRLYDFRDANKFPKEQIRTLSSVYENFAQLFANQLTGTLRAACNVTVLSIEETPYFGFNASIPTPVILAILNMAPLEGSILMMISAEVAYSMINRIFGGSIEAVDTQKSFTEIELVIIERIIHQIMGLIDESWQKVVEVDAMLERIETSPQFAQIVALNEPVAIITMEVTIGDTLGLVNVCIPHIAIEPVAQQLSTKLWFTANQRQVESRTDDIRQRLTKSDVTMAAVFRKTTATIRDILCLQVGDVVQLNHNVDQFVSVEVEGVPKFSGVIGVRGSKYAVQVTDVIQEEDME